MSKSFHIDIDFFQKCKNGQNTFGDVFLKKYIREENRKILVLSDGMGSGVKANVLAMLTASMALNFVKELKDVEYSSELIMNILPKCSERQISYSTFTVLDIKDDNTVEMIVYDNPLPVILTVKGIANVKWSEIELTDGEHAGKKIYTGSYKASIEDRIIFYTDGITQSGIGINSNISGWKTPEVIKYIEKTVAKDRQISSKELSGKIVHKAELNDELKMKDDASCSTVYFREPRELLICSGPSVSKTRDMEFSMNFNKFQGKKVICGGTTADILKRELDLIELGEMKKLEDDLPPISYFHGVDLTTEGIMTLSKVEKLLTNSKLADLKDGAAERVIKLIRNSDRIKFLVGTAANEFHGDFEYKMRIEIIKGIIKILEEKLLLDVDLVVF